MKRSTPAWASLWDEHMRAEFPARLRGAEVAGVDLVVLDADIAGCVLSWGTGDTEEKAARENSLRLRVRDVAAVLEALTAPDEVDYFRRLQQLALVVLEAPSPATGPQWCVLVDATGGGADHEDRDRMTRACDVLLELLRPQVQWLEVDAYSDFDDVMPADVREVENWIAARGESRRRSNLGRMAVQLDPQDDTDWQRLRVYAAWSINVDLYGNWPLATFHDSGHSVTARLDQTQVTIANQQLPPPWEMVPLAPLLRAEKQQRRFARLDRRAARAERWRGWWRSRVLGG